MNIDYRTKYKAFNLIFGLAWAVMFGLQLGVNEEFHWIHYGWILLSAAYFSRYLYQLRYPYLVVEDGHLVKNGPLGQRMALAEIVQVRSFAGEYILRSESGKMRVDRQILAPESLPILLGLLENLDVERR